MDNEIILYLRDFIMSPINCIIKMSGVIKQKFAGELKKKMFLKNENTKKLSVVSDRYVKSLKIKNAES